MVSGSVPSRAASGLRHEPVTPESGGRATTWPATRRRHCRRGRCRRDRRCGDRRGAGDSTAVLAVAEAQTARTRCRARRRTRVSNGVLSSRSGTGPQIGPVAGTVTAGQPPAAPGAHRRSDRCAAWRGGPSLDHTAPGRLNCMVSGPWDRRGRNGGVRGTGRGSARVVARGEAVIGKHHVAAQPPRRCGPSSRSQASPRCRGTLQLRRQPASARAAAAAAGRRPAAADDAAGKQLVAERSDRRCGGSGPLSMHHDLAVGRISVGRRAGERTFDLLEQ